MSTPAASTARGRRVVRGDHHERNAGALAGDDIGHDDGSQLTKRGTGLTGAGHLATSTVQGTHGSRRQAED